MSSEARKLKNALKVDTKYDDISRMKLVQLVCFLFIFLEIEKPCQEWMMVRGEIDPEGLYGRSPPLLGLAFIAAVLHAIHLMAGYVVFLGFSCFGFLLSLTMKPRGKTTVTLLQQMRRGWTDDDVAIIEENFPRMGDLGETTNYELGLVILWILLSAIIQMYTMKQQKAVQKQKKKEKSRVKPTVEVYTIKPISMTLDEKKNEELTEIPDHDQLYANSTKVRFLDEKKEYEPDN